MCVCVCVCVCVYMCVCVCVCVCVCEDKSDRLQSVVHFNTTDVSTDVYTPYWFIISNVLLSPSILYMYMYMDGEHE